jgi:alkylhydroperoxidase family enzyme
LALEDPDVVDAVLRDVATAPIGEPLRAALALVAALTDDPAGFGPDDVDRARAAGLDDEAIADAIMVCALFNMIDRCADALGFRLAENFDPRRLLHGGYLGPPPAAAVT